MPKFRFTAVDQSGKTVSETIDAADREAAAQQLSLRGLTDVVLGKIDITGNGKTHEAPVELADSDFTDLAHGIADITAAGKPLSGGLRALAEETPSPRLRRGLLRVADQLDQGQPVNEALSSRVVGIPGHLTGLVEAGVKAGCLDRVLQSSLDYSLRSNALRRSVKLKLAYPVILTLLAMALITFLLVFIVPNFRKIYEDFDTELPGSTVLLLGATDLLTNFGLPILVVIAIIVCVSWLVIRMGMGPAAARRAFCKIPLFGSILRLSALMEYCHLLAVLLESRMPLPDALRYSAGGVHDADLAEASLKLSAAVSAGQPFAWTASSMSQFPSIFCQFAKWGERHHAYPEALHAVGDIFEGRARVKASLVGWILEPFVIVGIGTSVGSVVLALFIPLIQLLNDLS